MTNLSAEKYKPIRWKDSGFWQLDQIALQLHAQDCSDPLLEV